MRELAPGADRNAIRAFYRLAKLLEKHNPGVRYHVDHIIPLSRGGLHHQDNLQVMRADFNLRKSNKTYSSEGDRAHAGCAHDGT
ncbi:MULTISPECIES: HNH endonuclease [Brevundimonas]|jgi:5-methylcytosine-specific restriction endonuclease McrA|uniref:HNH endonuclease n=1 Tax=Brevundimonas vesicularis TaxID=41276 RepID=A0ABU4KMT7_BREVE|nr:MULTISPECIES: HNH endonuclease signature motif containing protein [Brevundimonas]MBK1969831.1 HNH endonuclease [Brevundimonas diminuta]MDX2334094.1 HNH endonuclease [Brevundimonas vesicularis]